MSALGQKRTCAVQKGMSALPPKADINRGKRMSAKCHKQTSPFPTHRVPVAGVLRST